MKAKIKSSNTLVFLIFLSVVLIVYRGTINNHTLLVGGDGITYYLSKYFLVNSLASGELPFWNPFVALGTPFLADIQQTVFSPFNILYFFFDTIIGFNIFHALQLTFAGFFMFLYINEIFKKRSIGIFIGFIFAFSSMIGGNRIEHTVIITTIIFFPLILFFLERFKNTGNDKYLIFSSIGMAIHFLSGFTQIVIYFDIVFFVYYIYVCRNLKFTLKMILVKLFKWLVPYFLLCAIQLIPTLQLMGQSGRDKVSFEFFSVLAYDLRILLMMIFPYGYLDKFESFGAYASSGIDIEIYIGIIPFMFLIYAIIYHYKDNFIKLISGIMIGAFFFGMAPNIPLLSKFIYEIPIIGSFRVSSRILSVFLICGLILFGYTLSKLNEKKEIQRLIKFSALFTIFIVSNMFVLESTFSQPTIPIEISNYYAWKGGVFFQVFMLCCVNLIGLSFLYITNTKKYMHHAIIGILCLVTIADVGKYSLLRSTHSSDEVLSDHTPLQIKKLIEDKDINYRFFALLNAPEQYNDSELKSAKFHRNLIPKAMFFNSYMTFVDQKYKNYNIDETKLYPFTTNSLRSRNDLISMMSIQYILDAWDQKLDNSILTNEKGKQIFSESDISILNNESQLSVKSYPVKLEPNSAYKITIKMTLSESPQLFYVDFYNETYDDPKQDGVFNNITAGTKEYSTIIYTEESVSSKDVNFRLVSKSNSDIQIIKVDIDKVKTIEAYNQVLNEDGIIVYENANAKPILYVPKHVQSVDSFELLYGTESTMRLDEFSYIQNLDHNMDLTKVNTTITDIIKKNNSVSANVTSDKNTFINHSQLSYPGWKVYVDDKQVPIYNVNNLIQGAEVPAGNHHISFVYDPLDVKLGASISLLGVALCCYYLFYPSIRKRYNFKSKGV
ncbi:Bacterial membrane protein YfhO [compost metagenome]